MEFFRLALALKVSFAIMVSTMLLGTRADASAELEGIRPQLAGHSDEESDAFAASDAPHDSLSLLQMQSRWAPVGSAAVPAGWGKVEESVIPGVDPPPVPQRVVWINAYPRSGSSLLLSLVSKVDFPVFTIFEPCANGDELADWLKPLGCGALLSQLSHCNFTGVIKLQHWGDTHTIRNGAPSVYYPNAASRACQSAGLVAFKTVQWGHDIARETIPFLKSNPHVYAIEVIRDPRSIYVSMMTTDGFFRDGLQHKANAKELLDICDNMHKGLSKSHDRLMRVVFEKLITSPNATAKQIFSFMSIPSELGAPNYARFLSHNINAENCSEWESYSYSDCRYNSTAAMTRKLANLPASLSMAYGSAKSCSAVAHNYGYDA